MQTFHDIMIDIQENGRNRADRTGFGIKTLFGVQKRFDLTKGFPVPTSRKFPFKTMVNETLFFLTGSETCEYLDEHNVKIWKQWTEPKTNSIGKMYGVQLRKYPSYKEIPNTPENIIYHKKQGYQIIQFFNIENNIKQYNNNPSSSHILLYKEIDQLQETINNIINNPNSRRHVISLWNPTYLPDETISPTDNVLLGNQALANCHGTVIQFYIDHMTNEEIQQYNQNKIKEHHIQEINENTIKQFNLKTQLLSCQMYQRSADIPTAIGFNVSQYALLTHIVAHLTNTQPYQYIHTIGDAHIYNNQNDYVDELTQRETFPLPQLIINPQITQLNQFTHNDFQLINHQYNNQPIQNTFTVAT